MRGMKDSIPRTRNSVPADRTDASQSTTQSVGEPFLDADGEFFVQVVTLQDGLIAWATGESFDEPTYRRYRGQLLARHDLRHLVPPFVRKCRDFAQFWGWIKVEEPTYAERRLLIWEGFGPLIDHLEHGNRTPSEDAISVTLASLDADGVSRMWQTALDRRVHDPEGAITLAKSLLEAVCKHVLDGLGIQYDVHTDLPKLWSLASKQLNLAPSQHHEKVFRAILGNCQAVVSNLAAVRNKLGDAHGHGHRPVKPQARHAEFAVNLSGSMASFLVATWENWRQRPS